MTSRQCAVVLLVAIAPGFAACQREHPAAAAQAAPSASGKGSATGGRPQPGAQPPRQVKVIPAVQAPMARTVASTGTLAADDQVLLGAKVPGRLAAINVDLGSRVKKGEVVGRIDPSDYQYRLDQALAALQG